jgi:arylsulfatase A-like enzyme
LHGNECPGYQEGKGACVSPIPWEYSVDHFVGRSACEYIETYGRDRPFALMVGFPGPHCPYDPTREFLDAIDPDSVPAPIPAVPADSRRLRERSIRGNRQAWNGVDYSEFTTEDKRRIRTHYAALVTQIDYEVGRILESLDRLGLTENTVIIFAADHGDYLGDHDLIGKGTFYEASTRVPLLVRSPSQFAGGVIHDGLVELGDITATILALAGRKVPDYMDSSPLPGVGAKRSAGRDRVIGMLPGAWMLHDGRYKLAKYETGDVHLFDLDNDPQEQRNLATEPSEAPRVARMDAELTQEIMRSVLDSHFDKNVDPNNDLWSSVEYGFEGRPRKYPAAR